MIKYVDTVTGELFEGDIDDIVYEEQLSCYIHVDDRRDYYMDDIISDISCYEKVEYYLL